MKIAAGSLIHKGTNLLLATAAVAILATTAQGTTYTAPSGQTLSVAYGFPTGQEAPGTINFLSGDCFQAGNRNKANTSADAQMTTTPEPASLMLLGTGLLGLGNLLRRHLRRRQWQFDDVSERLSPGNYLVLVGRELKSRFQSK